MMATVINLNLCDLCAVAPLKTFSQLISLNTHSQRCELNVLSIRFKPFRITIRINAWTC